MCLYFQKIKPKDVAKFIVTHKGKVTEYLNKPKVDQDKACARLLMHKSLQDKYKFIRERFSNVRIEDLLMSRQERRKLKKEEKEKQKKKKEKKDHKVVNSTGDWDVEDVKMVEINKQSHNDVSDDEELLSEDASNDDDESSDASEDVTEVADEATEVGVEASDDDERLNNDDDNEKGESVTNDTDDDNAQVTNYSRKKLKMADGESESEEISDNENEDSEDMNNDKVSDEESIGDNERAKVDKIAKTAPSKSKEKKLLQNIKTVTVKNEKNIVNPVKKAKKKAKTGKKNKNFNEKILNRKFKKGAEDVADVKTKVVDPFFVTATGENYMSVVEPRQPDEFKEIHRQGNRKLRRAAMFGHEPRFNPRQDKFRPSNDFNTQNGFDKNSRFNRSRETTEQSKFANRRFNTNDKRTTFNDRKAGFNDRQANFNDRKNDINDRSANFNGRKANFNDSKSKFIRNEDEKPEKLHPSWEAKKKQSGILPFQGKKIVFDDT